MPTALLKKRPWMAGLTAIVLFLLAALALVWVFRLAIAEQVTERWCSGRGLDCQLDVEELATSGIVINAVSVRNQAGNTPVEAGRVQLGLKWDGLFKPRLAMVRVDDPVIRLEYTPDGTVSVGGLEDLAPSGNQPSSGPMPAFDVRNARIEALTPAGPVTMRGDVSGELPYQAKIQAEIEPADLETDAGALSLEEGRVDLELAGIKLVGEAHLKLSRAEFETLSARDITLDARMAESFLPQVNWTATAASFNAPGLAAEGLDVKGSTGIVAGQLDEEAGPLARLRSFSVDATADALRRGTLSAGATRLTGEADRKGGEGLSGKVALETSALSSPWLTSQTASLSGEGEISDDFQSIDLSGEVTVGQAGLPDTFQASLFDSVQTGPPLGGHADALKEGLASAAAAFDAGTGYRLQMGPEDHWSLVTTRPLTLKAANGAAFTLTGEETRPVLNLSGDGALVSGIASLSGPSLPQATIDIASLEVTQAGTSLKAGGIVLDRWQADGLALSARLSDLELETASGTPRIKAVGEAVLDGAIFGQRLETTKVFGGIDASLGEALRVQSFGTRCIGIDSDGFRSAETLTVGAFALQLCPPDGRLVQPVNGALAGRLDADRVRIPFRSDQTTGTLSLDQASLDWRAASTASLSLTGTQMSTELEFGENTLILSASDPKVGFRTTSPLSFTATTGRAEIDGTLIPADVSLGSLRFDATLPESGLSGSAEARSVVLKDLQDDPLYEPLTGDLSAVFGKGLMQLSGPVTTVRGKRKVADINMTLDLVSLDGEASVDTPDLVFEPGGFQPTALSERVRGFLSNARGQLNAGAAFDFDGGEVSGTGYVEVRDFGFDTLRVGAVNGVNGRIDFDDLIQLHTPPGQTVRVGAINPGIPLNNGEISFQLLGPTDAIIEKAAWPFAGGELIVGRSEWTIAGAEDIIEISARQLELTQIIGVFNLPDIKADGTVSGRFPVELSGPNVYVRDAVLKADEEGGTLAYTGDIGDAASQADERVSLAFRALKDFRFSVLELGASGNLTGSMMITLNLIGKSPDVLGGAPFAFNIGVDSELMKLVRTGQSMTGTDWLAEVTRPSGGTNTTDDGAGSGPGPDNAPADKSEP